MDMNGIDGTRASGKPPHIDVPPQSRESAPGKKSAKPSSDRIEISEEAKKALGASRTSADARGPRVEAARQRLLAGKLSQPEVYERTAEKLLRSGKLKKEDEK